MFRIGIIGSENSHATAFAKLANGYDEQFGKEFEDLRVVGCAGMYPEANQALYEKFGLEFIAEKPEDMLGKVDAIMVTARDGKYHAQFARPFIEAGIPCFIDKPFTSDPAEAVELARLAKSKGVPLTGGSTLKIVDATLEMAKKYAEVKDTVIGANVTAPVNLVNEYGNFWFYSAHLSEIVLKVFGKPEWIWANQTKGGVAAVAHYADFDVTNTFTHGAYSYSGVLNLASAEPLRFDISTNNGYVYELRGFANMLRTGKSEFTYEELVQPVFYIDAILTSLRTGCRAALKDFTI